jgi:hypothetical protein
MQKLHTAIEEGTLLDQFLPHGNAKHLPQTGQVSVDRRGTPLLFNSRLFEGPDHLRRDFVQIFSAKDLLQVTDTTQAGARRVVPAFYSNRVQKALCKIPEQRNVLLAEDSCTSLGQFRLLDALNAASNGLVSQVSCGLTRSNELSSTIVVPPAAIRSEVESKIQSFPRLGGLHHRYAVAA